VVESEERVEVFFESELTLSQSQGSLPRIVKGVDTGDSMEGWEKPTLRRYTMPWNIRSIFGTLQYYRMAWVRISKTVGASPTQAYHGRTVPTTGIEWT
jgi:hypothetical protein